MKGSKIEIQEAFDLKQQQLLNKDNIITKISGIEKLISSLILVVLAILTIFLIFKITEDKNCEAHRNENIFTFSSIIHVIYIIFIIKFTYINMY